ncbi:MAG: glutamate mutase L, partial [Desulfitobacterium hafniense]
MVQEILLIDFGSTYTKVTIVDLEREEIIGTAAAGTTIASNI